MPAEAILIMLAAVFVMGQISKAQARKLQCKRPHPSGTPIFCQRRRHHDGFHQAVIKLGTGLPHTETWSSPGRETVPR